MSFWIYKCNSANKPHQVAYGDWEQVFKSPDPVEWGSTEWTRDLDRLVRGDLIIAHQTDRNEIVGLARVERFRADGTHRQVVLLPLQRVGRKVKPLKDGDPRIARIPALRPGPIQTIYEISDSDARLLLSAAGVDARTLGLQSEPESAVPSGPLCAARPFDPESPPKPPAPGSRKASPEETAQLQEQASRRHHALLRALHERLSVAGWSDLNERPGATDLEASKSGQVVLFEAKTLTRENMLRQIRNGLGQLLWYRFRFGRSTDSICLVVNATHSLDYAGFLEENGAGLVVIVRRATECAGRMPAILRQSLRVVRSTAGKGSDKAR